MAWVSAFFLVGEEVRLGSCRVGDGGEVGARGVEAEAAPGFGDYDAVAGVAGVEADLDGEVDADLADVLGEVGDVLGALVGDAGDAIAVEEHSGSGGGRFGWGRD